MQYGLLNKFTSIPNSNSFFFLVRHKETSGPFKPYRNDKFFKGTVTRFLTIRFFVETSILRVCSSLDNVTYCCLSPVYRGTRIFCRSLNLDIRVKRQGRLQQKDVEVHVDFKNITFLSEKCAYQKL
jgi:hypothetical protein